MNLCVSSPLSLLLTPPTPPLPPFLRRWTSVSRQTSWSPRSSQRRRKSRGCGGDSWWLGAGLEQVSTLIELVIIGDWIIELETTTVMILLNNVITWLLYCVMQWLSANSCICFMSLAKMLVKWPLNCRMGAANLIYWYLAIGLGALNLFTCGHAKAAATVT